MRKKPINKGHLNRPLKKTASENVGHTFFTFFIGDR